MPRVVAYYEYLTRAGDSFDQLALDMYNDERKAGDIVKFNPDYCDVLLFEAGIPLKLPVFSEDDPPETLAPWRRS